MADSAFWRELAAQFLASPDFRADGHYVIGSEQPWKWQLAGVGADFIRGTFEALARRAASEIASAGTPDLLTLWLEELRKGSYNFQLTNQADEVQTEGTEGPHYLMGSIHGVCRASATLCKKLEANAIQAEFEEKQRDNPKNWSPFRQRIEAFESVKEVRNEPPYQIPEAVVRSIIAEIDGIKPEDVTWKRIGFEIAGLGGPNRRHIEVIPTPKQEPPQLQEAKASEQAEGETSETQPVLRHDPKALRDSYFANFPDEKIKIRDLCWAAGQHYREWKRWLAGELKDGSTPDLAFRRILTSGKRPLEYNKRPRPDGWE